MRKKLFLALIFILALSNFSFARWVWSDKANGYYYFDENTKQLLKSCVYEINGKFYYFTDTGKMLTNGKSPEGYYFNENREWVQNGVVVDKNNAELWQNHSQETTKASNIINNIPTTTKANETKSQEITPTETTTSSGRLLKNFLLAKQNVEIIKEKSINGTKKTNVIDFKGNEAFVSVDTKKYNKLQIKAERIKSYTNDVDVRLALIVNGEEEDSLEFEEEEYSVDKTFTYSLNDDVDLVLYVNGETNSYSNKDHLYITNGRLSKYTEKDDD